MIEITFIQKFVLFLGHPAFALMMVIASLLVFAGIGSWYAGRPDREFPSPGRIFIALGVMLFICLLIYDTLFVPSLLHLPWTVRGLLTVCLMAPLGFCLGMPFPAGIAMLRRRGLEPFIPWAWGINGAASVTGSMLNLLSGITFGFTVTLGMAALLYGGAWSAFRIKKLHQNR